MSRIGKMPITIPDKIQVEKHENKIIVKGDKGVLEEQIHPDMTVTIKDNVITVERPSDNKFHRSLHGLTRSLIHNMIFGLTEGNKKTLKILGVGYRAEIKGTALVLQLGFSHPIYFKAPEGIQIETPAPDTIIISGIDKQLVGQVAAKIRSFRPPEPYKGKGVRYENEYVKRKAGKATV